MVAKTNHLTVALNGIEVGVLSKRLDGSMTFQYSDTWLAQNGARPISLSLPLSQTVYKGSLVYNFFDNLLPDNNLIRNRIQARFQVPTNHPFDILSAIGMDCVGAIQLFTEHNELSLVNTIEAVPLTTGKIAKLLSDYRLSPLGMSNEVEDFRISIAGAQEKTALLWFNDRWCRPCGTTPTSHIVKLPIGRLEHSEIDLSNSCENEWICLEVARRFGLPVAESKVVWFKDIKTLVVERFDRQWSKDRTWLMRLPQEDMCQALGVAPARKYESDGGPGIATIMELLLGSEQALQDREYFIKSQILFWLLAAIDGHAKNFSLMLLPGSSFRLTPFYDIISAYPHFSPKEVNKHKNKMAMALLGKNRHYEWKRIQPHHYVSTSQKVGFSTDRVNEIMANMKMQTDSIVNEVAKIIPADFPDSTVNPILEGLSMQARKLPD